MRRLAFALLVVSFLAPISSAQPLADRIPADAVIYVGWRGSANLGPTYDGSHTKAVVDASGFPQLFNQFLPDLTRKVRTKDRNAADVMDMVTAVGAPLWRHPSALYFGGIDVTDNKRPRPRLALLCDAGDEAPQLVGRLNTAIERAGKLPIPITATTKGNLVIVSTFEFPAKAESPLSARKEFIDASAQVHKDPLASAYLDGDGLLQTIDLLINAGGDAQAIKTWPNLRDAMGLAGLKRIAWTAAFDGADFGSRAFIEAPAPRKGVLALLDNKPLPDDLMKAIPKDATLVAAGGFDLSRVLAEVRAAMKAIDPQAAQQLEKGISAGSLMLGANMEKDLIDPIGPHWAMYCSPSVGGNGLLGLTVVNRLDDPAKAERTLGQLEILSNNMIAMQMRKQKDAPRIAFRQTKTDGMAVHFLAVPFVSPAWGVKGQNLYVAPFPQVVSTAANQATNAKESILDNEAFTKARSRLGGDQANGVQWLDLPAVGPEGYGTVLAFAQLGLGFADMFGVPAPPMVLPPLDKLRPHFTPVLAVSRADERGFYYHKVVPFPGAENFGTQSQVLLGQNAMLMSILLPSLNRARETANRVKCASNLKQIGLASLLFSNENRGKQAATLGELLRTQDITIDVFVCPSSGNAVPADVRGGPVNVMAEWVDANSSYVWAGAGKTNEMRADEVLCYERMHNHDGDGINIVFGDGHVEFLLRAGAEKILREQNLAIQGAMADDAEPGIATRAYYTIDDGKTWFADDINKIPPFEKDGRPAYRVYVYKCPNSPPFVSHLERYTPEAKKALEAMQKAKDPNNPVVMEDIMLTGIEVKKPGTADNGWVKQMSPAAAKVMELKCPDGKTVGIEPVVP
jgi:prepilin-type processing-associated H-X9-DG protein